MSELSKKYKKVIKNVDEKLQNKEEAEFVKNQIGELVDQFLTEIEKLQDVTNKLIDRQHEVEDKMRKVEQVVDSIEKDIYLDSSDYDIEIVCPYCNFNFSLDPDETRNEIECPECKNIIEIDWDGESFDEGCSGSCGTCSHGCGHEEEEDDDDI